MMEFVDFAMEVYTNVMSITITYFSMSLSLRLCTEFAELQCCWGDVYVEEFR